MAFFKVLISDFPRRLKVPQPFLKHFDGKVPSSINLKHSQGMSWDVRMEETDQGFTLTEGFADLVRDLGLEFGDFAVFWMVGKRTFRIVVYGRDLCEKALPHHHTSDSAAILARSSGNIQVKMEEKCVAESEGVQHPVLNRPSFVRGLRPYEKYILDIPAGFVKKTGLNRQTYIRIRDPRGNKWEVELRQMQSTSRFCICRWHDIFVENKMNIGDILVFTFNENGNELEVKFLGGEDGGRLAGRRRF
ncbi:hypothetical protein MLD38_031213 [Melastoma candidum]|uniref:Uncharacterized protein n=1 Tax=Melastoma candidum TaxID=119954 RepID=A0ACB9MQY3_9MYRT|nr:hypothetical protein MLD38_031213 [Melastoma candidum]